MLERIEQVENIPDFLEGVKAGNERLMGFGHRVYKNYDPRARIIRKHLDDVFEVRGKSPLLEVATELEKRALDDDYFTSRKLYPNVDFYSGLIYEALGLPVAMFPVMFAIGRTSGWIAQWLEMVAGPRAEDRPPAPDLHGRARPRLRADRAARLADLAEQTRAVRAMSRLAAVARYRRNDLDVAHALETMARPGSTPRRGRRSRERSRARRRGPSAARAAGAGAAGERRRPRSLARRAARCSPSAPDGRRSSARTAAWLTWRRLRGGRATVPRHTPAASSAALGAAARADAALATTGCAAATGGRPAAERPARGAQRTSVAAPAWSLPAQPLALLALARPAALEQRPEARRVVEDLAVADLVPDDVVEHALGREQQAPVEAHAPVAEHDAQRVRCARIERPL